MIRTMTFIVLLFAVCGCVTKHAGVNGVSSSWKTGQTTLREVVAKWGNPDKIERGTWIWKDWNQNGGKFKAAYMRIGVTISSAQVATREHRLTFGEDGVLVSEEVVDSVPGGAEWTCNPW